MKSVISLAVFSAVVFGEPNPNELMAGTYEFEIMGRPHRLYLCDSGMDDKSLYWSVADRTNNEYTVAVGRDANGVEHQDNKFVAKTDIFKLYGDRHLQGYYELTFDMESYAYSLRERFPELDLSQAGSNQPELWNEYELVKMSPEIVGNPDMEGYQCFHPLGNVVYQIPLPSKWESDWIELDHGYQVNLFEENALTACWKSENEFHNVMQAGFVYGYDFEWDGALLLSRFDSVLKAAHCSVGSQFMVILDNDLAVISYQCEDRSTGRQFLTHLQMMDKPDEMCPFETDEFVIGQELNDRTHENAPGTHKD